MQMKSETLATIRELATQVRDESKSVEERRAALRHIAVLKNEGAEIVSTILTEDLRFVASAILPIEEFGWRGLSLRDAAEIQENVRAQRKAEQRKNW